MKSGRKKITTTIMTIAYTITDIEKFADILRYDEYTDDDVIFCCRPNEDKIYHTCLYSPLYRSKQKDGYFTFGQNSFNLNRFNIGSIHHYRLAWYYDSGAFTTSFDAKYTENSKFVKLYAKENVK